MEDSSTDYHRITFYFGAALYGGDEPVEILLDPVAWAALNNPKDESYPWVWCVLIGACMDD